MTVLTQGTQDIITMTRLTEKEFDEVVMAVVSTVNRLVADGVLTVGADGFELTFQGKAWVDIRDKLRAKK